MMFSFVNNLQIIYMFPLWRLYIPSHYNTFLDALDASDFNVPKMLNIKYQQEYENWIYSYFLNESQVNYTAVTDRNYLN